MTIEELAERLANDIEETARRKWSGPLRVAIVRQISAALRSANEAGAREEREACARLCDRRAADKKSEAADLVEHYGPDANDEASMYDADAIGATMLAKAIRARSTSGASSSASAGGRGRGRG